MASLWRKLGRAITSPVSLLGVLGAGSDDSDGPGWKRKAEEELARMKAADEAEKKAAQDAITQAALDEEERIKNMKGFSSTIHTKSLQRSGAKSAMTPSKRPTLLGL